MMKKRLLVFGGLILVAGLIVFFTRGGVIGKKMTTCQSFVAAVQKGDAKKSYDMLSEQAQESLKYDDWQKQVPIYQTAYGEKNEPKLASDKNATSLNSSAESLVEKYTVTNFDSSYTATCYLTRLGNSYIVDGFVSEVKY